MIPHPMLRLLCLLVFLTALADGQVQAQSGEPKSPSLGDLFNKVKELKVPESVSGLPQQLTDLRDSYLKTSASVEELKKDMAALREEIELLKASNQRLESALAEKSRIADSGQIGALDILASDLGAEFARDRAAAMKRFQGRYLKVQGAVERFDPVSSDVDIHLRVDGASLTIRCTVRRDANFFVDVAGTKDRLVSRTDRSSVLVVGQPVTILGTLDGADLNVHLVNCTVDGVSVKAPASAKP